MSFTLIGSLMKLQNEVDMEAINLIGRFVEKAIGSGNPKEYLKEVLRVIVNTEERPDGQPQIVQVKLLPKKK